MFSERFLRCYPGTDGVGKDLMPTLVRKSKKTAKLFVIAGLLLSRNVRLFVVLNHHGDFLVLSF